MRSTRWVPLAFAVALACSQASVPEVTVLEIPLDGLEEVITQQDVALDAGVSSDGAGSILIDATGPTRIEIADVEIPPIDDARLIYRAQLRSRDLEGTAYLEMWCVFPDKGEYFSRALQAPLSGTSEWTSQETPFLLQKGQVPSRVRLNVVVDGKGTVWIDDVVLVRASL